jgi:hypothetical protein
LYLAVFFILAEQVTNLDTCYKENKKEKRNLWFIGIDCSLLAFSF